MKPTYEELERKVERLEELLKLALEKIDRLYAENEKLRAENEKLKSQINKHSSATPPAETQSTQVPGTVKDLPENNEQPDPNNK